MPAPDIAEPSAFTIINHAEEEREELVRGPARNVNVVKPLQREPADDMGALAAPHSILDPKFSRALDYKLRRLKEKEILQANLRRPTKFKPRNGFLAASNPNISSKEQTSPGKQVSRSNPRIDIMPPENEKSKISPKMDKSPSPGRKSRTRKISGSNDGEKPRFITTVKTGQFLLPPPELASLLGLQALYPAQERERVVYAYASKPKALPTRCKPASCAQRARAAHVFGGVRALVAGVVGMRHMLDQSDKYVYQTTLTLSSYIRF